MQIGKKTFSKGILKDILIVAIGVIVIWAGLQVVFGVQNPFYVVASGSMIPVLQVYDVLIVQGHVSFEDIKVGDIIVFNRPSGHDKVIVHRVASIINDEPKTIRTKGDANVASIPGTDFPIMKEEYIGKVVYVIPQVGYVTQLLKPPVNYILIVIVIGIMVVKQMSKKKNEIKLHESFNQNDSHVEPSVNIPELDKIQKDSAYSKHEESKHSEAEESKSEKDQK